MLHVFDSLGSSRSLSIALIIQNFMPGLSTRILLHMLVFRESLHFASGATVFGVLGW